MSFLLDTNVISALAPTAGEKPAVLIDWLERHSDRLYLSVVTWAELNAGVAKARRIGATRKAEALAQWLLAIDSLYGEKILPFDRAASKIAGALLDEAQVKGLAPGFADLAICAIAKSRGMVLLTRTLRHFAPFCAAVCDPFENLPE